MVHVEAVMKVLLWGLSMVAEMVGRKVGRLVKLRAVEMAVGMASLMV